MGEQEREINLFDFIIICWRAVKRFFRNIGVTLLRMFRLSVQYIWITLLFVILGCIVGYIWTRPFATTYKGECTVTFTEDMRPRIKEGFAMMQNTLPQTLVADYGFPEEAMDNFKELKTYNVIDQKPDSVADFADYKGSIAPDDTMNVVMPDRLRLRVYAKGATDFNSLRVPMQRFFHTLPMMEEADSMYKQLDRSRLAIYERELERMDSLLNYDYFEKTKQMTLTKDWYVIVTEKEREPLHGYVFQLMRKRDHKKMQVESDKDIINFEGGFVVHAMNPLWKFAIGVFGGYVLSVLVALAVKYRRSIAEYMGKR